MKNLKKVLALVLAVVMIMSVVTVASAKTYTDVKGTDNYANAIDALSSLKILDGFKNGDSYSFKAEDPFTRAQAAKIVAIVHNAATNGAIKDQDAISGLYSNAQNPFVDCNNSWALPFINYCRITGLADGMTATTYEPNRYVTGVQFLKLMLTTLNFDTAKEGYTGTGWDVNVLNRANEVGLTAGLADGWKAIAPITRGEAAQVLYNALTKYLVEYGQKVKNTVSNVKADTNKNNFYYTESFISNEQVAQSGFTLGGKMGIKITRANDVFMRPGYKWAYGTWSAFYMDAPVASYTEQTTLCDVLVDGAKIKKTSKTPALVYFFRDGVNSQSLYRQEVSHAGTTCTDHTIGGNGALTQVFKVTYVEGGKAKAAYVITVIDTFLTKVSSVKSAKHNSTRVDTTEATLYAGAHDKFTNNNGKLTVAYLSDYAKGDAVLFNLSTGAHNFAVGTNDEVNTLALYEDTTVAYDNTNRAVYGATLTNSQTNPIEELDGEIKYAVPFQKAGLLESATFSGQSYNRDTVTVNGTRTPVNCTYTLTEVMIPDYVTEPIKVGKKTTNFYTDQYGNVIGDYTSSAVTYGIIDSAMWVNDGGLDADKYAQVKLIDTDAKDNFATVASYAGKTPVAAVAGNAGGVLTGTNNANITFAQDATNNSYFNDANRDFGVVTYSVSDGKYTLNRVPANRIEVVNAATVGGQIVIKAGQIDVVGMSYSFNNTFAAYTNDNTKFVVRTVVDGKYVYTPYAGINALPEMHGVSAIVGVKDSATATFASFVYVIADNAIFTGSDVIVYVTAADCGAYYAETGDVYHYYVYLNGEKTEIIATNDNLTGANSGKASKLFDQGAGVYKLHFVSGDKKVSSATKITTGTENWIELNNVGLVVEANGMVVSDYLGIKIAAYNLVDAKIYIVTGSEVKLGTADDIGEVANIMYKLSDANSSKIETLFVENID
ncbi:MAG: S-layer homology domain-containing protein [Clostridiales bacterium]|nr:S-layer homology domain-containing protein [Clostridiales bacterium]